MVVKFLVSGEKIGKIWFVIFGIIYSKMCLVLYRKKRIIKFFYFCCDYYIVGG